MSSALVIFQSQPNSHPFQERHVQIGEPVKIGRSVARARPAPNNAIFDCKVLSRNHALIWFEDDKFWLQDTRSSNGTFVNSQRLSKGAEESTPKEIFSGDAIQFGVDVMENSRRITHGCIICTISLYYPDGNEAKRDASVSPSSPPSRGISPEMCQLAQLLQDSLQREKHIERKFNDLQNVLKDTQAASATGWQAMIDEDRLLSRIEVLESQLQVYAKHHSEDVLRQELVALQDEKFNYETTAKTSMSKALEEKLEAVHKLSELEVTLSGTEHECSALRERCELNQTELHDLAAQYTEKATEVEAMLTQLQEAEAAFTAQIDTLQTEKLELEKLHEAALQREQDAQRKVESLEMETEFQRQQLSNLQENVDVMNEENKNSIRIEDIDGIKQTSEMPEPDNLRAKLEEAKNEAARYKSLLEESERKIQEKEQELISLEEKLKDSTCELADRGLQLTVLEEKLARSDAELAHLTESALQSLDKQVAVAEEVASQAAPTTENLDPGYSEETENEESEEHTITCDSSTSLLEQAKLTIDQRDEQVRLLQDELSTSEQSRTSLSEEVTSLQLQLEDEVSRSSERQSKAQSLLEDLNTKENSLRAREDDIKLLHKKLADLEEENERQRQIAIREKSQHDCSALEAEVARYKSEGNEATQRAEHLQVSHERLQKLLEEKDVEIKHNVVDSQKVLDRCKNQLSKAKEEVSTLQARVEELECEACEFRNELDTSASELSTLAYRSRTLSLCSMLPLVLLLLGILTAMSPLLSVITGTDESESQSTTARAGL